jgi:hypothetical protein
MALFLEMAQELLKQMRRRRKPFPVLRYNLPSGKLPSDPCDATQTADKPRSMPQGVAEFKPN